jgi:glutathione-regulated potassium-efflux system ancillary protein KefC
MIPKMAGLIPTVRALDYLGQEGSDDSLTMSTGLTFGTISPLFGLNHHMITQVQYSHRVATLTGSAGIPTAAADAFFMPRRLLSGKAVRAQRMETAPGSGVERRLDLEGGSAG